MKERLIVGNTADDIALMRNSCAESSPVSFVTRFLFCQVLMLINLSLRLFILSNLIYLRLHSMYIGCLHQFIFTDVFTSFWLLIYRFEGTCYARIIKLESPCQNLLIPASVSRTYDIFPFSQTYQQNVNQLFISSPVPGVHKL